MTRILSWLMAIIAVVLAVVVGGRAMSAQDKYTLKVPNGLAFSEFKGYEGSSRFITTFLSPNLWLAVMENTQ